MKNSSGTEREITPQMLLQAYCNGIFPMANSADDPGLFWIEPDIRAILPLNKFHAPHSLKKVLRKNVFDIRYNQAFDKVVIKCAEETADRNETWINDKIRVLYGSLHNMGYAHSVEAWQDDKLCGGLYGVSIGGAFFGESMFSRQSNASKVCLAHLVERLKTSGFSLLDTQFSTPHLERFGVIEIAKNEYIKLLKLAILQDTAF